jgi:hypothetical protein
MRSASSVNEIVGESPVTDVDPDCVKKAVTVLSDMTLLRVQEVLVPEQSPLQVAKV